MRPSKKAVMLVVLTPLLIVAGYAGYQWATYIDEVTTSGTAYGFDIGSSKQEALESSGQLKNFPDSVIYVTDGPRAGDHFSIPLVPSSLVRLEQHDQWDLLLDGDGHFFNVIRLTFHNERLVRIYRHRQHFELP